jgi:hypothetical protein
MTGTPEQIFSAKGAWLAAMASHEMPWLEVIRLWLEYLELADAVSARKIRRILKHAEHSAAKTADELFPAVVPLGARQQKLRHATSRNHPRSASTPLRGVSDQNRSVE